MNRKRPFAFMLFLLLGLSVFPGWHDEEFTSKARKIAVLVWHDSPNDVAALRGLKRGLVTMNLAENIVELRANENEEIARKMLKKAVRDGYELIVALGTESAKIAASEVTQVPIVFTAVTNPVLSGISPSWQGSGRNIAGTSNWLDRREMLSSFRLALPSMRKLLVLRSPNNPVSQAEISEAKQALSSWPGLKLLEVEVKDPTKVHRDLRDSLKGVDAVWLPIDFPLYQEKPLKAIVQATRAQKIPVFSSTSKCAGAGALVVMTVDYELLGLKASALIRDILVRKKAPGDLAIGRMKSSRLFVDLAEARRIELKLPFELILSAHRLFGAEAK